MGKVTSPFHLAIARVDGRLDVAGLPAEGCDDHADALRRELDREDSALAYATDSTEHDIEQYEVYVVGQGNRKNPEMFTPEDVRLWREEERGLLAP